MEVTVQRGKLGYIYATVRYFEETLNQIIDILLCSKYNPIKEAESWANHIYNKETTHFLVYGIGLGYHVQALLGKLDSTQHVYVIDTNKVLMEQLKPYQVQEIYEDLRCHILIVEEINELEKIFTYVNDKATQFSIHSPSLKLMPSSYAPLKKIFEGYNVRLENLGRDTEELQTNRLKNTVLEAKNVSELYGRLDKPVIIVSGGPSLDYNIQHLKNIKEEAFIFATGRTVTTLINQGIKVDMCCIIDCQETMYEQLKGVKDTGIPLVFLDTANHKAVKSYQGPRYIAYGMDYPEEQLGRIETGGSVATAILDLSIRFGGNPIIFVGQDLAFTHERSHCDNVLGLEEIPSIGYKKVRGVNGEYIYTTTALLHYKYHIENKILRYADRIQFINATEGGAFIEGCLHQTLEETLVQLRK